MTNRAALLASLVAFSLLLVAVPAIGQSDGAPTPSADDRILYAHHQEDADEEYEGWMNTLADDSDSDDVAMGESQECLLPEPIPEVDSDVTATWTLTLDPNASEDLVFERNGTVFLKAYIGASGGSGENLTANTTIRSGDVVVAFGDNQTYNYTAADDGTYDTIEWAVPVQVDQVAAGQPLVWEIALEGEPCSVESGPFLGVSEERGKSAMMLPLIDAEPPLTEENLTGGTARVALTFDEPTDARYLYDWSAGDGTFEMAAASNLVNGTAFVKITAPNGQTRSFVLEGEMATPSEPLTTSAGTWTIEVNVDDAEGEVAVGIRPTGGAVPPGGPSPAGNQTAPQDGNQTSFPDDDDGGFGGNDSGPLETGEGDGGESSGIGMAVALLGLVAAAAGYGTRLRR